MLRSARRPLPVHTLLVIAMALAGSSWTFAQAPSIAPPTDADPGPRLMSGGGAGGARAFRPGRWGSVAVNVVNPTDEAAEIEISYHFESEPELDFGKIVRPDGTLVERERVVQETFAPQYKFTRRLWLPPHSRRAALCPLVPPNVEARGAFRAICTAVDVTDRKPRVLRDTGGVLQRDVTLSIPVDRVVSGVLMSATDAEDVRVEGAYNALIAARLVNGLSRRIAKFDTILLPGTVQDFQAIDHLMIDNTIPLEDAATAAAIRQWLFDGGRCWLMLDAMGVEAAANLLGHSFHCAEVDRVDLTEVQFEAVNNEPVGEPAEYEQPIHMVRVAVEEVDVIYRVNGWPAAFVKDFGKGRVLCTTLDARALIRPVASSDRQSQNPDFQSSWLARPELAELAGEMFGALQQAPVQPEELQPYLAQQIGYRIVPRLPILVILSTFVGGLAIGGALLWKRGQQGRIGWLAPALALVATLPIAVLATSTQRSIPDTVAISQILPLVPWAEHINVSGSLAFYHQSPSSLVASSQGGWFLPEIPANDQTIHEVVFDDYDRWDWRNFRAPPSVIGGPYWRVTRIGSEPCRVEATFGPRGLEGRVIGGEWKSFEDAIVLVPFRQGMAIDMQEDGSFVGTPNRILAPEQFVGARILSDTQRRRQQLLRDVVHHWGDRQFPSEPTLLFWTEPLDLPFEFAEHARKTGDAMAYAPLLLQRPASSARFTIPHSFLAIRPVAGPGSRGVSSAFQAASGTFARMNKESDTWLRVQLPEVLLPMELHRLEIQLRLNAPSRTLTLAAVDGAARVDLEQFRNPSGLITATIDRPELLKLDERGGLRFGLLMGPSESETDADPEWSIDNMQLTAEGQIP